MPSINPNETDWKPAVALIGFRACGKSLLGRMLSDALDQPFMDLDLELARTFHCSITEFVATHGWTAFRMAESALLAGVSRESGMVVATGGGIVLDPCNRVILRRRFRVIWLRADPKTILDRIRSDPKTLDQRPPLTNLSPEEEIQALLSARYGHYQRTAHYVLSTDSRRPERMVGDMIRLLEQERARNANR